MKSELVLFGRHINMASQARRRGLVQLIYAGFAALMAASWVLDRWHISTGLIIFSASYLSRLVLGGFGAGGKGMIKPFLGNEVHAPYARNPSSLWSRMAWRTIPKVTEEREFCSDEHEVRSRDSAHEVAYRRLGIVIIFTFMVAFVKEAMLPLFREDGVILSTVFFDKLIYGRLIASFILFLTLPQSIQLWNEPDMEESE